MAAFLGNTFVVTTVLVVMGIKFAPTVLKRLRSGIGIK